MQTKILTPEISDLLGVYFVCEKVAKKLIGSSKGTILLTTLKQKIKIVGMNIDEYYLNLIFNTSWGNKGKKSFRNIRNKICHECSISERNYAINQSTKYKTAMYAFLNSYIDRL